MGNEKNNEVVIKIKADTGEASLSIGGLKKQIVDDLQKASAQAVEAFNKLKESGTASPAEVGRAFAELQRTIAGNNALIVKASKDGFGAVGNAAGAMADGVNAGMGSMEESSSRVGRAWGKLKGAWLEITAAVGVVHFLKQWVNLSVEAEEAFNKLKIQIEKLGLSYKQIEPEIQSVIKATAKYAIVQDGDVAKALQQLIFLTGDARLSMENLNLVFDLAYQKGISVEESTSLIGRALKGHAEMLGRVIPQLNEYLDALGEGATAAQKSAIAVSLLNDTVAGSPEGMTDHKRKVLEASKAWDNFRQNVGDALLVVFDNTKSVMEKASAIIEKHTGNWVVYAKNATSALAGIFGVFELMKKEEPLGKVIKKSTLELEAMASSATVAYMEISRSGTASAEEIAMAHTAMVEAVAEVNKEYGVESAKSSEKQVEQNENINQSYSDIIESINKEGKEKKLTDDQILSITKKVNEAIREQGDISKLTLSERAKAIGKINALAKDLTKTEKEEADKQVRLEKEAADKKKRIEKELLDAKITYYNDQLRELKSTLSRAEERYKTYRDEVVRLEGEIKKEKADAEEVLKDMRRKFFTDEEKNLAILKDAEGDLSAAKKAAARGDYAAAVEFFKKTQADYKALVDGVKDKDEKFAGSAKKIYDTAIKGYEGASKGLTDALTEQQKAGITAAMEQKKAYNDVAGQVDAVAKKVDELVKEKKVMELDITVEGYDEAITKKVELEKATSSTHTIYVQEVRQQATGGPVWPVIRAATGRHFPGYGGGDRIPILGEAGEYMNRKESVSYWGVGLFDALNKMDTAGVMNALGARHLATGGALASQQGGIGGLGGPGGQVLVDLKLGDNVYTMTAPGDVAANLVKAIKKTHTLEGRYTQRYQRQ